MLNRVCLIGRLTKDPELRYTPTGVAVANFTLAVDRNFKNAQGERETDFIPCVVYRQTAEFVANYLAKGKMAAFDGRLQIRSYTAQDGQRRWVTEVIGENITLLSPKDGGQPTTPGQYAGQGQPAQTQPQTPPAQAPQGQSPYTPYGQQSPQTGFPNNPPPAGSMPPPPGYQPQGQSPQWLPPNGQAPAQGGKQQTGQPQQYSFGHQVNFDDDTIPF